MAPPSRSGVWLYFEKKEKNGRKYSMCKECGFEKSGWLASNNKVHLATHGIVICDDKPRTEAQELELEMENAVKKLHELEAEITESGHNLAALPPEFNDLSSPVKHPKLTAAELTKVRSEQGAMHQRNHRAKMNDLRKRRNDVQKRMEDLEEYRDKCLHGGKQYVRDLPQVLWKKSRLTLSCVEPEKWPVLVTILRDVEDERRRIEHIGSTLDTWNLDSLMLTLTYCSRYDYAINAMRNRARNQPRASEQASPNEQQAEIRKHEIHWRTFFGVDVSEKRASALPQMSHADAHSYSEENLSEVFGSGWRKDIRRIIARRAGALAHQEEDHPAMESTAGTPVKLDELYEYYYEDFATEKMLSHFDVIDTKELTFGGFSDDMPTVERQIDVAKQCLLRTKRVLTVSFVFSSCVQLMALLNNARLFPTFTGTLKVQLSSSQHEEALDGRVLAKMLANVFYSTSDINDMPVLEFRLSGIRHVSCLFRSLMQALSEGKGPESLSLIFTDIPFDVELDVTAYQIYCETKEAYETLSMNSGWNRCGSALRYRLSLSRGFNIRKILTAERTITCLVLNNLKSARKW